MKANNTVWDGFEGKLDNKGFTRFLVIQKGSTGINKEGVKADARFDGKSVLTTNKEGDLELR